MQRVLLGLVPDLVKILVPWAMAALISYLTTIGTMDRKIAEVREREDAHFQEVLRRLEDLKEDIRELRRSRP